MWVVAAFDELEHRELRLGLRAEQTAIQQLAPKRRDEALSESVVVRVGDRSMEGRTPAARQRSQNAIDVCCVPCRVMHDVLRPAPEEREGSLD